MKTEKRIELYTFVDFMAICGGLLGLCLGISLLSVIEIVYFSTLRLFWKIYRSRSIKVVRAPPPGRADCNIVLRVLRTLRSFLEEFCNDTSIHGLRYFTEQILHWSERYC